MKKITYESDVSTIEDVEELKDTLDNHFMEDLTVVIEERLGITIATYSDSRGK